ncbi:MAG: nuclease-related domain-containing protein, partial [Rhodoglobus sp.]
MLGRLPAAYWVVRHDVMIGPNWNVDHIAVGPPGVFAIDSKFRSGRVRVARTGVWVDGYATDIAAKARQAAQEVGRRLNSALASHFWVQPVLA